MRMVLSNISKQACFTRQQLHRNIVTVFSERPMPRCYKQSEFFGGIGVCHQGWMADSCNHS
jgi:hypothetical protein